MKAKFYYYLFLLLVSVTLVSAIPGTPHQFYGSVTVNGQPATDTTIIAATVEGDTYKTVTKEGVYGTTPAPNNFFIEDPDGDRAGTITFYIGGMEAGTAIFENNGYTNLNFVLTTTCGDGYCLGDESCSTCPVDCGACTGTPTIIIHSPIEGNVYDTTKIDLEVSADQEKLVWMYFLNTTNETRIFVPTITMTVDEGYHELTVWGIKEGSPPGISSVSFSVQLPQCGNGVLDGEEECEGTDFGGSTCSTYDYNSGSLSCLSNCTINATACYNTPSPPADTGSSGSGGGGGGGGGGSGLSYTCNQDWDCTEWSECENGWETRECNFVKVAQHTQSEPCPLISQVPAGARKCEVEEEAGEGSQITATALEKAEEETEEETTEEEAEEPRRGLGAITGAFIGAGKTGIGALIIIIIVVGGLFIYRNYAKNIKKK